MKQINLIKQSSNMRIIGSYVLVVVLSILLISCKNPLRKLEKETILKRMSALESFSGSYTETGVAATPQQTQIFTKKNPVAVLAKNVVPGSTGATLYYANGTLVIYFPQSGFGVRYRHIPELNQAQQVDWLEREYDWHIEHYDIEQMADTTIAGFTTKVISYKPKTKYSAQPFIFEWHAAVAPDFAFALQNTMYANGNEKYRIAFDKIEFQKQIQPNELEFRFPSGSTVAEYDMDGKNYSLASAKGSANFKITLPKTTADFQLKKIVRVKGLIPAFAFYFEDLPYQTFYTQVRDYGLNLVPARGLLLEGRRKYRVNFAGAFKTIYFLEKGVYHTVVSSKPLSEILNWLELSVKPRS